MDRRRREKREIQRRREGEKMGLEEGWKEERKERAMREGKEEKMSFFFIQRRIIPQNCTDKESSKD